MPVSTATLDPAASPAVRPVPGRAGRMAQTFGERLKQLREDRGWTQADLADKAGMHKFGVAKIERGEREPGWRTLRALCTALGVSCAAFEDTEEPPEGQAGAPRPKGRPR